MFYARAIRSVESSDPDKAALNGRRGDAPGKEVKRLLVVSEYTGEKTVFVREYLRCRYGRWESVKSHHRRPPCR
jgi:hypothetical protein